MKGNKQRQRERSTKKENDSDNSYLESSKDVLYAEINKEPKKRGVKIDESIFTIGGMGFKGLIKTPI